MRLIDADDVIAQLEAKRNKWDNKYAMHRAMRGAYVDSILVVRDAPTADVEPVRHGRWEYNQDVILYWVCSECAYYVQHEYKFCPNCGAKMDGGEEDAVDR